MPDLPAYCRTLADAAHHAASALLTSAAEQRRAAILHTADALLADADVVLEANARDQSAGRDAGLAPALLDRLRLDDIRLQGIADAARAVANQPDPVGETLESRTLPNGLRLRKRRVPIGVIFIIFESRPNVTIDAAVLCLKSGNASILRGGKEAAHTNAALARAVAAGLADAGLPPAAVQLVDTPDRAAVGELLRMDDRIDLCIPRGGPSLIRAVVEQARVPVIKHDAGNCHTYVHHDADPEQAVAVCLNAKTQRPGVCNATETVLLHRDLLNTGLAARVLAALADAGVELRGDADARAAHPAVRPATDADWDTEYLALTAAVRVVDSLGDAITHINRHGSRHTEAILTTDADAAERFTNAVDAANVMVNCSTRFADGGEFGLGAEIGISTNKLHARGPMGAADLTTYQWQCTGTGHTRS